MTTLRWMLAAAVAALISAGLFAGPPWLAVATVVGLVLAPFVLGFYVLAKTLGLSTLFR